MIIAVALHHADVHSRVHDQFGRCPWFGVYDSKAQSVSFLKNDFGEIDKEAGRKVASWLISQGVNMVVAGRFGLKTEACLQEKGVNMIVPHDTITLEELIRKIKR